MHRTLAAVVTLALLFPFGSRADRLPADEPVATGPRVRFDWRNDPQGGRTPGTVRVALAARCGSGLASEISIPQNLADRSSVTLTLAAHGAGPFVDTTFDVDANGLGVTGGRSGRIDAGEAVTIRFDRDVFVESAELVAAEGGAGGFHRIDRADPVAITGREGKDAAAAGRLVLGDIGPLPAGATLRFDSGPGSGDGVPGDWRLANLVVRVPPRRPLRIADFEQATAWPELRPSIGTAKRSNRAVYVEVPRDAEGTLTLPRLDNPIGPAYLLGGGPLDFRQSTESWSITLAPATQVGPRVVVLETVGEPFLPVEPWVEKPDDSGIVRLAAHHAVVTGEKLQYEPQPYKNTVGYWVNPGDWAAWHHAAKPGRYVVRILQGCGAGQGGSTARIGIGEAGLEFEVVATGHFQNFRWRTLGEIEVAEGTNRLELRPIAKARAAIMDCRAIELVPEAVHRESTP